MKLIGLDVGTGNLVAASSDNIDIQRNAFLTISSEASTKRQLKRMNVPYIELDDKLHLVGKHAFEYANIFNTQELRRPMRDGLLNPTEVDALPIMKYMLGNIVGALPDGGGKVVYSVPANPIDQDRQNEFHSDVIKQILGYYGWQSGPLNEAVALGNVGLEEDQLTGIAISFGAGMSNVAVIYQGLSAIKFSVAKSGDWVSEKVAADTGITVSKANYIKEQPGYSIAPGAAMVTREQNAIRSYYQALIRYILANIAKQFNDSQDTPQFPKPVPIVCGGGTAMVEGFIEVFKEQFTETDFPIAVSDIRLVDEPFTAVARGCLVEAQLEAEDE